MNIPRTELQTSVANLITHNQEAHDTSWGFAALDAHGELVAEHYPHKPIAAASVNKLLIGHAMHLAEVPLDKVVQLEETDIRPGFGILKYVPLGHELSVGSAVKLMLSQSDETATRICVRATGGPLKVMEIVKSDSPISEHIPNTALAPTSQTDNDPAARYGYGYTAAAQSALLLREAMKADIVTDALSHGNFYSGLRRHIESDHLSKHPLNGLLRMAKVVQQMPGKITLPAYKYDQLIDARFPKGQHPNKEGTDPEDGLYHDVACIGGIYVAALSESKQRARRRKLHPSRHVQAAIGEDIQAYAKRT